MPNVSTTGQARMRDAIYVAASDRRDNCGGCVYCDKRKYSDKWCRAHSAPTTQSAICAMWEPKRAKGTT